jgi:hypothetical protein
LHGGKHHFRGSPNREENSVPITRNGQQGKRKAKKEKKVATKHQENAERVGHKPTPL